MTKKLRARQALLEKQGKFATDMNEKHRTFDALDIDRGYDYLPEKPLERVRRAVILSIVAALGPVVTWFAQGARVEGKENLRAVRGGAISVCNHVHTLDTLMVKNALGPFRTFHTGSYYLLKRGVLGRIFKAGGFLPVGTRFRDIKNLQDAVGELVARGKIVNFYPEHALWPQYEKLRPFQSGAFRYAAKFGVPVLPLFIEFRETKLRRLLHGKKKVILHILPAVDPASVAGETLHERTQALSDAVFEAMRAAGCRLYGKEVRAADFVQAGAAAAGAAGETDAPRAEDRCAAAERRNAGASRAADAARAQSAAYAEGASRAEGASYAEDAPFGEPPPLPENA